MQLNPMPSANPALAGASLLGATPSPGPAEPSGSSAFAKLLGKSQARAEPPADRSPQEPRSARPASGKTGQGDTPAPARTLGAATARDAAGRGAARDRVALDAAPDSEAASLLPLGVAPAATDEAPAEDIDPAVAEWLNLTQPTLPPEAAVALPMGGMRGDAATPAVAMAAHALGTQALIPQDLTVQARQATQGVPGLDGGLPSAGRPALSLGQAAAEAQAAAAAANPFATAPVDTATLQSASASTFAGLMAGMASGQAPEEAAGLVALATPAGGEIAAMGSLGAPAARAPDSGSPLAVVMPTPATAPEFKQALGVQISLLARDGVQQASLHLNPADMGPISVQIALDGSQARVDFGVASAATRQIIEAGLPELASSLRDAGFTLSGGGVSQHPQGREGSDRSAGGGSSTGSAVDTGPEGALEAPAHARTVNVATPGHLDLYA